MVADRKTVAAKEARGGSAAGWVTLREAAGELGVSISVLRKWYRGGDIASRLVDGPYGPQRMVRLPEVRERAKGIRRPREQGSDSSRPSGVVGGRGPLAELDWLLDRWLEAERRAARAEMELKVLHALGRRDLRRLRRSEASVKA